SWRNMEESQPGEVGGLVWCPSKDVLVQVHVGPVLVKGAPGLRWAACLELEKGLLWLIPTADPGFGYSPHFDVCVTLPASLRYSRNARKRLLGRLLLVGAEGGAGPRQWRGGGRLMTEAMPSGMTWWFGGTGEEGDRSLTLLAVTTSASDPEALEHNDYLNEAERTPDGDLSLRDLTGKHLAVTCMSHVNTLGYLKTGRPQPFFRTTESDDQVFRTRDKDSNHSTVNQLQQLIMQG
ncbi:hypothetical protein P4O66_008028, partial [Electrophorus voltai]